MRFSVLVLLLPVLLVGWSGCSNEAVTTPSAVPREAGPDPASVDDPCGEVTTVTLYAGQTIDVGTVSVANDGEQLCVTYATTGDWKLTETHLHIGLTLGDIPQTRTGNPKVGKFAYSHILSPAATTDEFCFPLSQLGYTAGAELYVAAHAVVVRYQNGAPVQTETAWGDGQPFPGNNWATYLMHTVQECNGEGPFNPGDFVTHTQSEWGDPCSGNSPGCYLGEHLDPCLGGTLVAGCEWGLTVQLTNAESIFLLLPTDGTPGTLSQDYVNPGLNGSGGDDPNAQATEAGELLGQVVALTLNVYFDACDPSFGQSDLLLGDLTICDPTSPVSGWTVGELLAEANAILGGCGSGAITPEEANAALKAVNENFLPGHPAGSFLCPPGDGGGEDE